MNRETIKFIAVLAMLINHIGLIFFKSPQKDILMDIGYFTAITMCYFLVEGYHYTRSRKKYAARLLLFALISQIPYSIACAEGNKIIEFKGLNVIFNLFICFQIIQVCSTVEDPGKKRIHIAVLMAASLACDWSVMAPVFVLLFLKAGSSRKEQTKAWIISILFWGMLNFLSVISFENESGAATWTGGITGIPGIIFRFLLPMAGPAAAAVCILCFYNGKQSGKFKSFSKWFFYIFYPAHLLVLGIIRICLTFK